ncbi:MAG: hypothetical protein PVG11_09465, partial [Anaerolineae bacterium]
GVGKPAIACRVSAAGPEIGNLLLGAVREVVRHETTTGFQPVVVSPLREPYGLRAISRSQMVCYARSASELSVGISE